jgi:hypothetical protein
MISATTSVTAVAPDPVPIVPMNSWQLGYASSQTINISGRDFLHALNPLQHLPIIGTIYRAITHDDIPEPLKVAGSLAFSAITGNVPGAFIGIAMDFATGIMALGPAVPGHPLQVAQWGSGNQDGPSEKLSSSPGVTYADGSTGTPTWRPGELTDFDMTQSQPAAGDTHANYVAAIKAYNHAVEVFQGPAPTA